jgi:hypothetical protein
VGTKCRTKDCGYTFVSTYYTLLVPSLYKSVCSYIVSTGRFSCTVTVL